MERFNENDGVWRTMDNGQKIFIRKGESFRDAYRRRLSANKGNNNSLRKIINEKEDNDYNEEEVANMKINNSPERKKLILRKAYQAEEKKLREEIGKIMRRDEGSEMDYEGRKIKIHSNRQLTDEEETKLDRLSERLRDVEHKIRNLR